MEAVSRGRSYPCRRAGNDHRGATPPGRTIGKTVAQTRPQVCDVSLLLARTSWATRAISALLRLSKSTSYGVNSRGACEVPSLRLSKAVEGVSDIFPPPFLEVRPVSFLEFMSLLPGGVQFGGAGFPIWSVGQFRARLSTAFPSS